MSDENIRKFDKVAATWDEAPRRRQLAEAVSAGIAAAVPLHGRMQAMEYGCGTGLCGLRLAPALARLIAVDTSAGMLEQLRCKVDALGLTNVEPALIEPDQWPWSEVAFDLIFSSMVLHHVPTPSTLLVQFRSVLKPGGFLALADLVQEDGSFHDDPAGVLHFGFDPKSLAELLRTQGFFDIETRIVHSIRKDRPEGGRDYPIFLLTARLPG